MTAQTTPKYLTTAEYAELRRCAQQTIRAERWRGGGCAYIRLGGPRSRCLYELDDVLAWLEARKVSSTSDEASRAAMAAASSEG